MRTWPLVRSRRLAIAVTTAQVFRQRRVADRKIAPISDAGQAARTTARTGNDAIPPDENMVSALGIGSQTVT